ncbi:MAG: hypothetical protein ACYDH5_19790 [Acidimicrobiales bacterium]
MSKARIRPTAVLLGALAAIGACASLGPAGAAVLAAGGVNPYGPFGAAGMVAIAVTVVAANLAAYMVGGYVASVVAAAASVRRATRGGGPSPRPGASAVNAALVVIAAPALGLAAGRLGIWSSSTVTSIPFLAGSPGVLATAFVDLGPGVALATVLGIVAGALLGSLVSSRLRRAPGRSA